MRAALSVLGLLYIGVSIWSFINYGKDPKTCDGNYIIPGYFDPQFQASRPVLNKRYQLFLHREGARKGLSGIPVLFLPGNAGTYKQARSLGGVAHRIARWEQERLGGPNTEIDLFAMETRHELSAFDAKHLRNQAEFALESIDFILGLYGKEKTVIAPKSVVLVAHSMGGIVARQIPLLDKYREGMISTIITLASPHYEPPLALNWNLYKHYQYLNSAWKDSAHVNVRNITIVSIASGNRDLVLYSGLTHLDGIINSTRGFTVYSTGMPSVWATADHEGMVWCDQVLTSISTIIHRMSNPKQLDADKRMVLLRNLLNGTRVPIEPRTKTQIRIADILVFVNSNRVQIPRVETADSEIRYHLIRTPFRIGHQMRLLSSIHINNLRILGCSEIPHGSETIDCVTINDYLERQAIPRQDDWNITYRMPHWKPSDARQEFVSAHIPLGDFEFAHVIVQVLPSSVGFLYVDVYEAKSTIGLLFGVKKTFNPVLRATLRIPAIRDSNIRYLLELLRHEKPDTTFPTLLVQHVPPLPERKTISHIRNAVIGFSSPLAYPLDTSGMELDVWSDPLGGPFELKLRIDILGTMGALIERYFPALIGAFVACVFFVLAESYTDAAKDLGGNLSAGTVSTSVSASGSTAVGDSILRAAAWRYLGIFSLLSTLYQIILHLFPIDGTASLLFIGRHDPILLFVHTVLYVCAVGLLNLWAHLLNLWMLVGRWAAGRQLMFLTGRRFRIMFSLLCLVLSLVVDYAIILTLLTLYSLMTALATGYSRVPNNQRNAFRRVTLMVVCFAFNLPNALQAFRELEHVHDPSTSLLVELIFIAVNPSDQSINMNAARALGWLCLFCGWKWPFIVLFSTRLLMVHQIALRMISATRLNFFPNGRIPQQTVNKLM